MLFLEVVGWSSDAVQIFVSRWQAVEGRANAEVCGVVGLFHVAQVCRFSSVSWHKDLVLDLDVGVVVCFIDVTCLSSDLSL